MIMEAADGAVDLGGRRQPEHLINARRRNQNASHDWYPLACDLHGFFMAVAPTVVNNDGKGLVWWSFV